MNSLQTLGQVQAALHQLQIQAANIHAAQRAGCKRACLGSQGLSTASSTMTKTVARIMPMLQEGAGGREHGTMNEGARRGVAGGGKRCTASLSGKSPPSSSRG